MSVNIILYDRIWLDEYIERLKYQRNLLGLMENYLQREKMCALPEKQMDCVTILLQIRELARSLEVTEHTLRDYLNNVQNAAVILQK